MGAAFLCSEVSVPQGSWKVKSFPAVEHLGSQNRERIIEDTQTNKNSP